MKTERKPRRRRLWPVVLLGLVLFLGCLGLGISAHVCRIGSRLITTEDRAADLNAQAILVLGAAIWEDDQPCPMLQDRLDEAIALYQAGAAPTLLMSGDGREASRETQVMAAYAQARGVPPEAIVQDPAGYCTRDSILRSQTVYGLDRVLVVTQRYHLYRALYIARAQGMDAWGVGSDPRSYAGQVYRELREVLARNKDALLCMTAAH